MKDGTRPEAQRGYNDDLIMSLAGALWVREEAFMFTFRSDEMTKAMLNAMSTNTVSTKDFPGFNATTTDNYYNRAIIAEHIENQNKIRMANGNEEDLSWLISKG